MIIIFILVLKVCLASLENIVALWIITVQHFYYMCNHKVDNRSKSAVDYSSSTVQSCISWAAPIHNSVVWVNKRKSINGCVDRCQTSSENNWYLAVIISKTEGGGNMRALTPHRSPQYAAGWGEQVLAWRHRLGRQKGTPSYSWSHQVTSGVVSQQRAEVWSRSTKPSDLKGQYNMRTKRKY